ncbi:MAG: thioredoxin-like domain-containing protein [Bacteroidota bacterium]
MNPNSKNLLLVLCTLIPTILCGQGHKIDVTIAGLDADEAYLAYYMGDKQYIKDTVEVKASSFTFKGDEPLEAGIYLVVFPPDNQYFEMIVDQDQKFALSTNLDDLVQNMKIKGSQDNDIFYGDMLFLAEKRKEAESLQAQIKVAEGEAKKDLQIQLSAIDGQVKSHRANIMEKHPDMLYSKVLKALKEPEIPESPKDASGAEIDSLFAFKYYRSHYFDYIDMSDDRLLRTPIMYNKVNSYMERLTYRHPDSINKSIDIIIEQTRGNDEVFQFWVVHFLNKYANSKQMGMDAVYVHMVEQYYMKGDCFWADEETVGKMTERALAISPTLVGRIAPNFSVQDANGKFVSLHDVEADYTLLYFWDYDCGHCKKITPALAEAYKRYQAYNVKIFAVSINGDVTEWKEKLATYGLDQEGVLNVQDHRRISRFDQMYDIRSTPRLFVLDKSKNILAKQISVSSMEQVLSYELGLEVPEAEEETETKEGDDKE